MGTAIESWKTDIGASGNGPNRFTRNDSAAMDGFAVQSRDLGAEVTKLRLVGESYAGGAKPAPIGAGTAVRISTGAPMPVGADRVVMRENVRIAGEQIIVFATSAKSHVRLRASDFARGQPLLAAGTRMDARAMVVAAAADLDGVSVWRRPRLHLLSNGDELVQPGDARQDPRFVPDSLSEGLMLMARQWGAKPIGTSRSGDQSDLLKNAAQAVLSDVDILVMVGGASHGHRDFARSALMPLGLHLRFAGVATKPGKPLWYGMIGPTHILGLPGNPTAALTAARLLLAPLIAAWAVSTLTMHYSGTRCRLCMMWSRAEIVITFSAPLSKGKRYGSSSVRKRHRR